MNFITRKLFPLLLSCTIGGSINAMHPQVASSKNMSMKELRLGLQGLPQELLRYVIYLLLQNSIFDFQHYKTIALDKIPSKTAFSADGEHFWCLFPNFEIQLWNTKAGNILKRFSIEENNDFPTVALSPDEKRVAISIKGSSIRVYEFKTGEFIALSPEHKFGINSIAFNPDGGKILTGSCDKTARIYDSKTGKLVATLKGHTFYIYSVAFSPHGEICLTGSADNTARVWNSITGELLTTFTKHTEAVTSVAFSPNGENCITGSTKGEVYIWNAKTGELLKTLIHPQSQITSVAFSPNKDTVFTTSRDKTARVWSSISGELHTLISENTTANGDKKVFVRSSKTEKLLITLEEIYSIDFSPNGEICLIISLDKTASVLKRIYDFNCLTPGKKERAFKQFLTLLPLLQKPSSSSDDSSSKHTEPNSAVTVKIENQLVEEHSTNQQRYIRP